MMTAEELIRDVRLSFIDEWREDTFLAKLPHERRREFIAAGRKSRAKRRALIKSEVFRNLAQGYVAVGTVDAANELSRLITWLAVLPLFANGEGMTPQELVAHVDKQKRLRSSHVLRLREIAATVTANYASRLTALADEIENDGLALRRTEVGVQMVGDPKNLGRSGSAAVNAAGAWRGWFIRELHARLPNLDQIPQPYATMAALLTWAEIDDITPMLVRSILTRS